MSRLSSTQRDNGQEDSALREAISSRFREERLRVEPRQGVFAARIGVTQGKQSTLETGFREMKVEYLARAAQLGIDVLYVLTGQRSEGSPLAGDAAAMLDDYLALSKKDQKVARTLVRTMLEEDRPGEAPPPTIHDRKTGFRAGNCTEGG